MANVHSLQRLSEGVSDALHARHLCEVGPRAVVGGLNVDDVSLEEVHHSEPEHTTHCNPGREKREGLYIERQIQCSYIYMYRLSSSDNQIHVELQILCLAMP